MNVRVLAREKAKHVRDGIPHKTKIPRKPEDIGAELNTIADGNSGVLNLLKEPNVCVALVYHR
ncbi:hypothetical protein GQ600_18334 [Phytophthora cactorum]|nr:hypothetical protein GQ600_18334 [Phytophthora cactorum]